MAKKPAVASSIRTKHIRIKGFGRSMSGDQFAKLLIQSHGNKETVLVRIDNWGPANIELLNRHGAHLIDSASRTEFSHRLQKAGLKRTPFPVATQIGWHGPHFVHPEQVYGPAPRPAVYLDDLDTAQIRKYRTHGDSEGWLEIPALARGNSRFMLVLALAFVGPLGDVLAVEQPAFQLVGAGGSGKTTLAIAAGSVWGRHLDRTHGTAIGFGETWNATVNKFETVALAHNHAFLVLDETRVAGKVGDFLQTVMRLAASVEKGRLTTGPSRSWWVPVLSTSNKSLDQLAGGRVVDDAYRGRLIDIPNPDVGHGAFEQLHGRANHTVLAQEILALAGASFGVASRDFLSRLSARRERDEVELRKWLEDRRAAFLKSASRVSAPGRDIGRIREKFATVYAAGCLAIRFKILPWTWTELREALLACLRAHVDLVASESGAMASLTFSKDVLLDRLRAYVKEHRAEFTDLRQGTVRDPDHDHDTCPGYIADQDGPDEYLFSSAQFKRIAGSKIAAQQLKHNLKAMDAIRTTGGGREGQRFAVKAPVFDPATGKPKRSLVIAVKASAVAVAPDGKKPTDS